MEKAAARNFTDNPRHGCHHGSRTANCMLARAKPSCSGLNTSSKTRVAVKFKPQVAAVTMIRSVCSGVIETMCPLAIGQNSEKSIRPTSPRPAQRYIVPALRAILAGKPWLPSPLKCRFGVTSARFAAVSDAWTPQLECIVPGAILTEPMTRRALLVLLRGFRFRPA
jgi:hypothetical protein